MDELIEYCAGGARGAVDCDAARLANEVEKKTPELARELVDRAASPQELSLIADHLGGFLQERLGEVFVKQGKDPSQPIYRLGRELKKALKSHEDRLVYRGSTEAAVEVLERHADGARVEWIARTFEESGRDFQTLKKLAGRFLYSRELRDRLLGPLKERLAGSGVPEDDLEEFFAGIVKRGTPGRVRRGALSAQQAEDVRRLRERFDEEVSRRVQKEVGAIQKEFKRTLDEKERVDTIIRNMAEGLVVVDNEGKIQLMNPAAEKLLGISLEEGKGVPITQLSKAEHLLALARGPLTDQAEHVTKEIELKSVQDDTRRILQASSAVIENEQGRTVGMVSVLSDITRQKEIEEMKSAFVAHVSHELRTPLFAIEQSLALLLDKEAVSLNPQEEQFLSIAHRNIIRLARLVDDLLDVAKIEARQMRLRKISFKICDLVHHVAETVRGWAGTNQLTIEEKYPESDLEIEADPDRLTQVVTNLLGNAIKFTPPGGKITVEVDTHHSEPEISEEPCIAVSVQDTGIGIAREDQKRIFEKFEQVSLARPKGISSTGLGLTIAKEIVELHGGKIWLRSGEGEGSRFTFVIPRQAPRPAET